HRTLFDGPDGLASPSIEDVSKRLLADLNHRSNAATVDGNVPKNGVRREVVVPEPVVDRLKMPHTLSGFRFHTHETLGKAVVAWTIRTVVVAAWRRHGQVDVIKFGVVGHLRPDVRVPVELCGSVQPGVVARFPGARHRVERPERLSGADVERLDVPRWHPSG